jgi:1,2-diacylglycerol 3-beta-glucosyltransferase
MIGKRALQMVALPGAAAGAASSAHLVALLAAAIVGSRRSGPEAFDQLTFAVVVPAHDEETQIAATVRSIQASGYPAAKRRIVVVADNCRDRTAGVARSAGVEVWERRDPSHRGKGYALDWAFSRLVEDGAIDAVCVVDADCEISENLLAAHAARLRDGAEAVQAPYVISNPETSDATALRWASFALFNVVRPLGRHGLGLSSGLLGTGMAFSRRLLVRSPWRAFSYAEDREQHMRWVLDGVRVEFSPEAQVRSRAPTTAAGGQAQMARWDSGRSRLAWRLTPRLVWRWLRTGDATALDAALEPVLPPQSVLLGINLAALVSSRLGGARAANRVAATSLVTQAAYVAGGLAALNAPPTVWRGLLTVPRFVLRRFIGLSRSLAGGGPSGWERTERDPEAAWRKGPATDDAGHTRLAPPIS